MTDWDVRPLQDSHLARALGLIYGGSTAGPEAQRRFRWEFDQNPAGRRNVQVAVSGGRVVGVACHSTALVRFDGGASPVTIPLKVATAPDFRGRGIFQALEVAAERQAASEGVTLGVSFPNQESAPIFLAKLGWVELPPVQLLVRPGPRLMRWARRRPAFSLERVTAADELDDAVFADPSGEGQVVRTREYFAWRFLSPEAGDYRAFAIAVDGAAAGYIVIGHTIKRRLPLTYVAASSLLPAARPLYRAIRAAALGRGRLGVVELDTAAHDTSASGGFIRARRRLTMIGKDLARGSSSSLTKGAWPFQLGDTDFF